MKTTKAFLLGAVVAVLAIFSYQQHVDIEALKTNQGTLIEVINKQSAQIAELVVRQKGPSVFNAQ